MSDQNIYKHSRLRSPRSIRVIILKGTSTSLFRRAPKDQSLEVELEEVSLDGSVSYEALSYTWGGQQLDRPIRCHGKTMNITRNCEIALNRLRTPSKRRLWIDSICIDQSNPEEKKTQIPLMGEVYGKAGRVLVWLGEGTPASDAGFRYLIDIYSIIRPAMLSMVAKQALTPSAKPKLPPHVEQQILVRKAAFQEENVKIYDRSGTPGSNMLADIFQREWFTRMWTVQELVLGFKATFLCGNYEITWGDLVAAMGFLVSIEQVPGAFQANDSAFWGRMKIYQQLRAVIHPALQMVPGADDRRMSKVLTLAHHLDSWDPRDKMYALYGYLNILGVTNLPPVDYQLPVAQVYTEWTKRALLHDQTVDILYAVGGKRSVIGLPSWTPDWSERPKMDAIAHERFSASKASQLRFVFAEDDELHMAGIVIDTINERPASSIPHDLPEGGKIIPEVYLPDIIQRIQAWKQWIGIASRLESYPTGEPVVQALQRTMVQNGMYGPLPEHLLSDEVLEQFRLWWAIVIGYEPGIPNREAIIAIIDEAVDFALSRPAAWALYFKGDIDPLPVINTPEWRILTAVNYGGAQGIHHWIYRMTRGRTLFLTAKGYLGVGSDFAKVGDQIVLIAGMRVPMIVRKCEDGRRTFVGSAYVHGFMNGEKWPESEGEDLEYFAFK